MRGGGTTASARRHALNPTAAAPTRRPAPPSTAAPRPSRGAPWPPSPSSVSAIPTAAARRHQAPYAGGGGTTVRPVVRRRERPVPSRGRRTEPSAHGRQPQGKKKRTQRQARRRAPYRTLRGASGGGAPPDGQQPAQAAPRSPLRLPAESHRCRDGGGPAGVERRLPMSGRGAEGEEGGGRHEKKRPRRRWPTAPRQSTWHDVPDDPARTHRRTRHR